VENQSTFIFVLFLAIPMAQLPTGKTTPACFVNEKGFLRAD
jgi:hypothetical protein